MPPSASPKPAKCAAGMMINSGIKLKMKDFAPTACRHRSSLHGVTTACATLCRASQSHSYSERAADRHTPPMAVGRRPAHPHPYPAPIIHSLWISSCAPEGALPPLPPTGGHSPQRPPRAHPRPRAQGLAPGGAASLPAATPSGSAGRVPCASVVARHLRGPGSPARLRGLPQGGHADRRHLSVTPLGPCAPRGASPSVVYDARWGLPPPGWTPSGGRREALPPSADARGLDGRCARHSPSGASGGARLPGIPGPPPAALAMIVATLLHHLARGGGRGAPFPPATRTGGDPLAPLPRHPG